MSSLIIVSNMIHTTSYNLDILVSKIKRHDKSCRFTARPNISHDLSNVSISNDHVTIKTKNGEYLHAYGDRLEHMESVLSFSDIENIEWITPEPDPVLKARYKSKKYDSLYLFHPEGQIDIEGIGQAVFPVMSFIEWVRNQS